MLFEGNRIERSWGESIDPLLAEHVTVRHCTIKNVYSVGIYMDNSRHCIIDKNAIVMDDPAFWRSFGRCADAREFTVSHENSEE